MIICYYLWNPLLGIVDMKLVLINVEKTFLQSKRSRSRPLGKMDIIGTDLGSPIMTIWTKIYENDHAIAPHLINACVYSGSPLSSLGFPLTFETLMQKWGLGHTAQIDAVFHFCLSAMPILTAWNNLTHVYKCREIKYIQFRLRPPNVKSAPLLRNLLARPN